MSRTQMIILCCVAFAFPQCVAAQQTSAETARAQPEKNSVNSRFGNGPFRWHVGQPLLEIDPTKLPESAEHPWIAIKDPSVVRFGGQWHLFCTLRKKKTGEGRIRIGYLRFDEWENAKETQWETLTLTPGYHGAPQIFFYEPNGLWYLIYQAEDSAKGLKYGPCFSTNQDLTDVSKWTLPKPLYVVPPGKNAGLDFWVICDESQAFLFFTTLDGRMWRSTTSLESFPDSGWSQPVVALKSDIFEASHTYKIAGQNQYLTIVEAKTSKRRYFKGFVSDRLDGEWKGIASTAANPLVSPANVVNQADSWATSYSHGEFLRSGVDQKLEIDQTRLRLLFQGASDREYQLPSYGQIPWRLGILEEARDAK